MPALSLCFFIVAFAHESTACPVVVLSRVYRDSTDNVSGWTISWSLGVDVVSSLVDAPVAQYVHPMGKRTEQPYRRQQQPCSDARGGIRKEGIARKD